MSSVLATARSHMAAICDAEGWLYCEEHDAPFSHPAVGCAHSHPHDRCRHGYDRLFKPRHCEDHDEGES